MIRKLAVALLGAGVLVPGLANALGLGEITNGSGLGQPLNAKIELLQTRDLAQEEIKVNLASQKDFDAAGVTRDYALTELSFEVAVKPDGKSYVTVRSRRPMNEPYVNFLVEVLWPQGRLLREYTVLLDPPLTSDARRSAVASPVATAPSAKSNARSSAAGSSSAGGSYAAGSKGKPTWKVSRASAASAKTEPKPSKAVSTESSAATAPKDESAAKAPAEAPGGEGKYGPTKSNDSLWKIALKLRPSNAVSVHQTMVALAKTNSDAFIAGNINLLKTGKTLRAPSVEQAQEVSSSDAIKEVARQNSAWREMIAGNKEGLKKALASQQIQGSDAVVSAPPAAHGPDGQLKLASSDATSSAKSGVGGGGVALEGKLTAVEENLDKSSRENQDLKSHLSALQDQVVQSDKVLKLKDDQIAAMQAKMAQMEQEVAQAKANASAQPSTAPIVTPAPSAVTPVPAPQPDYNYQAQPAATKPNVTPAPVEPVQPPAPVAVVAEPQQAAPAAEVTKTAPVEKAEANPLSQIPTPLLYGLPTALFVGLLLVFTRKKKQSEADVPPQRFSMPEPVVEAEEEAESVSAFQAEPTSPERVVVTTTTPASADPIAEADIYIAYRQFPRAVDVLEKAITREPSRADLRLKLLEVLVETGDKTGFERHETALAGLGDTSAKVRAAELRSTLFGHSGSATSADVVEEEINFATDDTAFDNLSDFDANLATPVQDKTLNDLGLDFALDLDQAIVQPAAKPAPVAEAPGLAPLEFTLDDAFSKASTAVEEEIAAPVLDNALDFDLNFDSAAPTEAVAELPEVTLTKEHDLAFEPVADELGSSLPMLEESYIADTHAASDFSLNLEPALTELPEEPLLAADEPILMPNVADEAAHEEADFAFDPMTGEFEPTIKVAQALSAPTAEEAEDLEFLAGSDEISTKLDLARAYIDMGDREGAKDILDEVVVEGNDAQKAEARELISRLEA